VELSSILPIRLHGTEAQRLAEHYHTIRCIRFSSIPPGKYWNNASSRPRSLPNHFESLINASFCHSMLQTASLKNYRPTLSGISPFRICTRTAEKFVLYVRHLCHSCVRFSSEATLVSVRGLSLLCAGNRG
jgi:hypothetical protein